MSGILAATVSGSLLPLTHTYASGSVGNETVPVNSSHLVLECWGGGGAGQTSSSSTPLGGGGGAYTKKTLSVTPGNWGQLLAYSVGVNGTTTITNGISGSESSVTLTTFSATKQQAGGGQGGGQGGNTIALGGVATGGDINSNGASTTTSTGGSSPNGGSGGVSNSPGGVPGGGGSGFLGFGAGLGNGGGGQIIFRWS